ncbi:MAG: hypothetical protein N3A69_02780 [Leptospiraceae bacterium]|nr:hypothetical protein [Leptospiraceae bacterium]
MKPSGKTILSYLTENFDFIVDLFQSSKENNFFISGEVLINRCRKQNINLKKLEDYKIINSLPHGTYELNKRFTDFISFLIDDFRLDLPESTKKYQNSIQKIFSEITIDNLTLNKQKKLNEIIDLTQGLIGEIREFNLQIESNTKQLFTETIQITQNKENFDYTIRIQKATYLIENYIKPMNDIFNREHPNSFIKELNRIRDFANLQRHEQRDLGLREQFERLYQFISNVNESLLKNTSIMAKDVSPLLDRLKIESEILKGVEFFLLNAKQGRINHIVSFSELKKKQRRNVYSKGFELAAKHVFEKLREKSEPISLTTETKEQEFWVFDKETYKEKLLRNLPIENFFLWCYNTLKEEQTEILSENFLQIASLLLEKEIIADFSSEKVDLELSDSILKIPVVKVSS